MLVQKSAMMIPQKFLTITGHGPGFRPSWGSWLVKYQEPDLFWSHICQLFPINSQNLRNSSVEFRNSSAEFKNSSDHIYVLGKKSGPFWLAAALPKPLPRNRPETSTFACVGFLSLDRGCEIDLQPKFAGWGRRPRVFSCKIRCKLHLGPSISNTFPLWNSHGPFNDSSKAFYPFTLLALLFSEGTDSVHRLFPCFFAYSKLKGGEP